jgi:D-alanyl-D-alanine dipeptidase
LSLSLMTTSTAQPVRQALPEGFVYLDEFIPEIVLDIRYFGAHNFIGRPIPGYGSPAAIASIEAATSLRDVQEELAGFGLGLKVFDAYRPQRAVDEFVAWAQDVNEQSMKAEFYPDVDKRLLIEEGYIAAKSSHSRGSTVDLTLVSLREDDYGDPLDMGSHFDYFGPESWPDYPAIGTLQRAHRMLLSVVMTKHGFAPYPMEWWHFTLLNEPYPDEYFDFPIP